MMNTLLHPPMIRVTNYFAWPVHIKMSKTDLDEVAASVDHVAGSHALHRSSQVLGHAGSVPVVPQGRS